MEPWDLWGPWNPRSPGTLGTLGACGTHGTLGTLGTLGTHGTLAPPAAPAPRSECDYGIGSSAGEESTPMSPVALGNSKDQVGRPPGGDPRRALAQVLGFEPGRAPGRGRHEAQAQAALQRLRVTWGSGLTPSRSVLARRRSRAGAGSNTSRAVSSGIEM